MRLTQLVKLFQPGRFRRLKKVFNSPFRALLATAGIFKNSVELATRDGGSMLISRADRHLWDEFLQPAGTEIRIEQGRFKVVPENQAIPPYSIAPEQHGVTYKPQRWNQHALDIPIIHTLQNAEHSVYSQHGEDGILTTMIDIIAPKHNYLVEFGAHDGTNMSNSRYLIEKKNWSAFLIEGDNRFYAELSKLHRDNPNVKTLQSFITPENINQLFTDAGVPTEFGIMSIDIDSIDYYVWEGLTEFTPGIVIVEYNSARSFTDDYIAGRDEAITLSGTYDEGASLLAYDRLARRKGYQLIYTELFGSNAFFIHESCKSAFPDVDWSQLTVEALYQPPQFGVLSGGMAINGRGYATR